MKAIDNIVFGDNQFFGINHMSEDKAQQLTEKFYNIDNIYKVYENAFDSGVEAVMLNSNERAKEICDHFKKNKEKYGHIKWYPSIPYPHKYANLVAEKGIIPTINDILFKENDALGILKMISKGSSAIITKDAIKLMKMLVDIEMKMFRGLDIQVVFLQNVITDLLLGFDIKVVFAEYCSYIKERYNALPGLITANMPLLRNKLIEWEIENVVICTSFNKIGFQMSPDIKSYTDAIKNNDPDKYQIMAMSIFASGAIPPKESIDFINSQKLQSVVFGASSKQHIDETVSLLKQIY